MAITLCSQPHSVAELQTKLENPKKKLSPKIVKTAERLDRRLSSETTKWLSLEAK